MLELPDPLDQAPTRESIQHYVNQGIIDRSLLQRALQLSGFTPNAQAWVKFLNLMLLVLGAGLAVCGVFFFFAFNWQTMHRFVKLGLVQGGLLLSTVAALWYGLERIEGKILLTVSACLVGALMALFGQIYQTGADAYTLFLNWALVITGFAIAGNFAPLWLLWWALWNLTLSLYYEQTGDFSHTKELLSLFSFNGLSFAVVEFLRQRKLAWLQTNWFHRVLGLMTLWILILISNYFGDEVYSYSATDVSTMAILLYVLALGVLAAITAYHYFINFDGLLALAGLGTIWFFVDRWLIEWLSDDFAISFLVLGMIILGQTIGSIVWVRQRQQLQGGHA
ncbi:DUF2157 domain-containing protein [Herpetosiphon geysericola]|uniref:DUF2157 domain-containing protein n=1 Tax=Herpetosiphon geysericola TaxID=70996 RepID=UPI0006C9159A|nr:DUF2157 domain-containing protein [Herpetosiphon geysericola]